MSILYKSDPVPSLRTLSVIKSIEGKFIYLFI